MLLDQTVGAPHTVCTEPESVWGVTPPPVEMKIGALLSMSPEMVSPPLPLRNRPGLLEQSPSASMAGPGWLRTSPTAVAVRIRVDPPPKSEEKKLGAVALTVTFS